MKFYEEIVVLAQFSVFSLQSLHFQGSSNQKGELIFDVFSFKEIWICSSALRFQSMFVIFWWGYNNHFRTIGINIW